MIRHIEAFSGYCEGQAPDTEPEVIIRLVRVLGAGDRAWGPNPAWGPVGPRAGGALAASSVAHGSIELFDSR